MFRAPLVSDWLNNTQIAALRPKIMRWKGEKGIFLEEKLDGWGITIVRRAGSDIVAFGKKTHVDLWPKLSKKAELKKAVIALPEFTVLDGEAHAPGVPATSVPTMLNSGEGYAFTVFACPIVGRESRVFSPIPEMRDELSHRGFPLPRGYSIRGQTLYRDELLGLAKLEGIEGFIIKVGHYHSWWKLKPVETVDCIITGVKLSTSKSWYGHLKAFEVSVWDGDELVQIASSGTGLKKEFRKLVNAENADELLGLVIEIAYDEVASQGRLKFPRCIRFRPDKPAEQCLMEQLR